MFKKILSLSVVAAAISASAFAQAIIPISQARTATTVVHVTGTVLNTGELGPIRYIQDYSGFAIAVYAPTFFTAANNIGVGDSIDVVGKMGQYNNLAEFGTTGNPPTVSLISRGAAVPEPIQFDATNWSNAYAEINEGKLIRLNRIPSISGTGVFTGNTNYTLAGQASLVLRTNTSTASIVGVNTPSDTFDVVGIMSQFSSTNPTGGYQLLPRFIADLYTSSRATLNGKITALNIDTSSMTLSFNQSGGATVRLSYGTVPGTYTNQLDGTGTGTAQSFNLTGLSPATVYWVQVALTNASGTNTLAAVPFITKSKSSGKVTTYFTNSVNTAYAYTGNQAVALPNLVDDTLIAYIGRATESLDIAIYNWNNSGLSNITGAVNAAFARGVKVRVVADGSTAQAGITGGLNSSISVQVSPQGFIPGSSSVRYSIMHNKFVVIDANSTDPNKAIVWTGSTNWTDEQINTDFNNVIIFQDQSMAQVYRIEFEEMFGSSTLTKGDIWNGSTGTARFSSLKKDNTPHFVKVGSSDVEVYFSPSDATSSKIEKSIRSCNSNLQVAEMVITRNELATAIKDVALATATRGCLGVIVDDTNSSGSSAAPFVTIKLGVGSKAIVKPRAFQLFHHKYLIVDSDQPQSDPLVLTGSHNWSSAAENNNDENTVIVHDQMVANRYFQEFAARMEQFGTPYTTCTVTVAAAPYEVVNRNLEVYPNPASTELNVSIEGLSGTAAISVTDMAGRNIQTLNVTSNGSLNETINLSNAARGLYVVRVATGGKVYSQKVSVQ